MDAPAAAGCSRTKPLLTLAQLAKRKRRGISGDNNNSRSAGRRKIRGGMREEDSSSSLNRCARRIEDAKMQTPRQRKLRRGVQAGKDRDRLTRTRGSAPDKRRDNSR